MPPRWFCCLIVLFWLTTMGWFLWRDLWPTWRPGEPPPFHIDDVEEVQKSRLPIFWTVERWDPKKADFVKVFRARTEVEYHNEDDTYTLHARLDATKPGNLEAVYVARALKVELLTSDYRVTRTGRLRSLQAEVKATPYLERLRKEAFSLLNPLLPSRPARGPEKVGPVEPISLRIWGEVHDGQFFAHCRAGADSLSKPFQFDLPPTAVSYTGSVLMPLHPVNQVHGLRLGQGWRQPLVDPLRDAFASVPGFSGGVQSLDAHVLPQPQPLQIGDRAVNCLVIEYTDDENEIRGRTWVEQSTERVLQQEAILEGDRWIMKREIQRKGFNSSLDR